MKEKKWVPHTKGGEYRKWYGNYQYVIAFDEYNYGELLMSGNHLPSREFYFKEGFSWSRIATKNLSVRYTPKGFVFNSACPTGFSEKHLLSVLSFLNSTVAPHFINILNPTINFQAGTINLLPYALENNDSVIEDYCKKNIEISKYDWDCFEISWEFKGHPLVMDSNHYAKEYLGNLCKMECNCGRAIQSFKSNEEELNRIFIDIYDLQDELTPGKLEDKDVTVRKADVERDVHSFLSYLVGVIFGRYRLDKSWSCFCRRRV